MIPDVPHTYVISITTFKADGEFDEPAYRSHLQRMAAAGVGVYVAGAGSGEGYTLNSEENQRVLNIAVEELKGKVPVRAMGHEPRVVEDMLEFVDMAENAGVDAVQIYSVEPGHLYKPSEGEIDQYLSTVLDHCSIPAVLSTHFSVGYVIPPDLVEKFAKKYDHFIGMTVTQPDARYLMGLTEKHRDRLEFITGGGGNFLQTLAQGAHGCGTSEANTAPKLVQSLFDLYNEGDLVRLMDRYKTYIELTYGTMAHGYVSGVKAANNILGVAGGYPRLPRLPVPEESYPAIEKMLDDLGIREIEGL